MKNKATLIFDVSIEEYTYLKMASARLGISIEEFLHLAVFEKIEDIEDEWLADKARITLENIRTGREKTIAWNEMKKRVAQI